MVMEAGRYVVGYYAGERGCDVDSVHGGAGAAR